MSRDPFDIPPSREPIPESPGVLVTDDRLARAEARLAMLRELAELGMVMARELTRRAVAAPLASIAAQADRETAAEAPLPEPRHDPANAFARVSRAIRLTLALEAKAEADLALLHAAATATAAASAAEAAAAATAEETAELPRDFPSAHRNKIREAVWKAMNREISDPYAAKETLDRLYERLTEGERYDAVVHRPIRDSVAAICEDLGLHPDWSLWRGEDFEPIPWEQPQYMWERSWTPSRDRFRPNPRE